MPVYPEDLNCFISNSYPDWVETDRMKKLFEEGLKDKLLGKQCAGTLINLMEGLKEAMAYEAGYRRGGK
jgi:hypothetical protein